MSIRTMTPAERRARNRSLTSLLYTPAAYPGYSSCLGSLTRVEPSGIISFVPYGEEVEQPIPKKEQSQEWVRPKFDLESPSPTSPSADPTTVTSPSKEVVWQKSSIATATTSSGYGSAASDEEVPIMVQSYSEAVVERRVRYRSRKEKETETWRRRSVPATIGRRVLPEDAVAILKRDGHIQIETDVDSGEPLRMELRGMRRPESVMQLARRFAEIDAAQQNGLYKQRDLIQGKENRISRSRSERPGGIDSLRGNMSRPNMFKQMERVGSANSSSVARPVNPNSIKEALLRWVQSRVQGYPNVNVTNFSSSWADGMAFCALIHRFAPHAFDFNKLDPNNRRANFELAFKVSECRDKTPAHTIPFARDHGICPLLEVDDMIMMGDRPDWKCVFTYVQSFYKQFRDVP